jgi:hypothetical protein
MISITIFSKFGKNLILFKTDYDGDIDGVLSLEGKTIKNLEVRDDVIICELVEVDSSEG